MVGKLTFLENYDSLIVIVLPMLSIGIEASLSWPNCEVAAR